MTDNRWRQCCHLLAVGSIANDELNQSGALVATTHLCIAGHALAWAESDTDAVVSVVKDATVVKDADVNVSASHSAVLDPPPHCKRA